ncbi:hypothetical protein [Enterococcus avium]|uniref:hypothetical protein n=1 Tax=Enterococcus avium TaxID=33945 RepID=UPI001D0EF302|nr:hypothetical protein [Enterococcus avium]
MIFQDISSGTLLQWDTKTKLKYEKDEIINFTYDELEQVTPMDLFNEDEERVAISNPRKVQSLDLLLVETLFKHGPTISLLRVFEP